MTLTPLHRSRTSTPGRSAVGVTGLGLAGVLLLATAILMSLPTRAACAVWRGSARRRSSRPCGAQPGRVEALLAEHKKLLADARTMLLLLSGTNHSEKERALAMEKTLQDQQHLLERSGGTSSRTGPSHR